MLETPPLGLYLLTAGHSVCPTGWENADLTPLPSLQRGVVSRTHPHQGKTQGSVRPGGQGVDKPSALSSDPPSASTGWGTPVPILSNQSRYPFHVGNPTLSLTGHRVTPPHLAPFRILGSPSHAPLRVLAYSPSCCYAEDSSD